VAAPPTAFLDVCGESWTRPPACAARQLGAGDRDVIPFVTLPGFTLAAARRTPTHSRHYGPKVGGLINMLSISDRIASPPQALVEFGFERDKPMLPHA